MRVMVIAVTIALISAMPGAVVSWLLGRAISRSIDRGAPKLLANFVQVIGTLVVIISTIFLLTVVLDELWRAVHHEMSQMTPMVGPDRWSLVVTVLVNVLGAALGRRPRVSAPPGQSE